MADEKRVDWHLTDADKAYAERMEHPEEHQSTEPVDWHLTDADKAAQEHHEELVREAAAPLAKEHKKEELQEMARQHGLDDSGTKSDIAARVVEVESPPVGG